jgi:hypothetical protein
MLLSFRLTLFHTVRPEQTEMGRTFQRIMWTVSRISAWRADAGACQLSAAT